MDDRLCRDPPNADWASVLPLLQVLSGIPQKQLDCLNRKADREEAQSDDFGGDSDGSTESGSWTTASQESDSLAEASTAQGGGGFA